MKSNFKITLLLALSMVIVLSSCEKDEVVAPNRTTSSANAAVGSEKDVVLEDYDEFGGDYVSREDNFDFIGNGSGSDGNGNGKPWDPNGDYIGDDDDDSDLGNNSGKSLELTSLSNSMGATKH